MSSSDLAKLARDLKIKVSNHINFLALKAEDDPAWDRKVREVAEVRDGIEAIIAAADEGIGFRYPGPGSQPPNFFLPFPVPVPLVADAVVDSPMDSDGETYCEAMAGEMKGGGA